RLVKSTYETSHIPVVLLTALVGKAEELHALGLGADSYLTKPFDMALVLQRIRSIIQNRKILRDKALSLVGDNCVESVLLDNELNNEFITKATDVVWANISKVNFNKEEFASAMNVSTSLLYKKIKSLTDQSPAEFIKIIRLNYALKLLREGTLSVTEISELAGFSSPDYFGKAFRRHFGKAPSEV
ncbi:MAG: helix-turn-helix domain-containing protein, partial [Bacteroidota bacterium]|nr:helix-turn-helix domain-containing protein [Bacteroidota bacterium]